MRTLVLVRLPGCTALCTKFTKSSHSSTSQNHRNAPAIPLSAESQKSFSWFLLPPRILVKVALGTSPFHLLRVFFHSYNKYSLSSCVPGTALYTWEAIGEQNTKFPVSILGIPVSILTCVGVREKREKAIF